MPVQACIKNALGIDIELHPDGQFHHYSSSDDSVLEADCWVKLSDDGLSAYFGNFTADVNHCWFVDHSVKPTDFERKHVIVLLQLTIEKLDQLKKDYDNLISRTGADTQSTCVGENDYDL